MTLNTIDFRQILEQTQVVEELHLEGYKGLLLKATSAENSTRYYFAFLAPEATQPAWMFQLEQGHTLALLLPEERVDCGSSVTELSLEEFKANVCARVPEIVQLIKKPKHKPLWVSIFQFFIIPMGIVILSVMIYVFFGLATLSQKNMDQLVNELAYKKGHARWQIAYELAKRMKEEPVSIESTEALLRLFQNESHQTMRTYLAQLLGFTRNPKAFEPLVAELEKSGEESIETRIHVIGALTALGTSFKVKTADGKEQMTPPSIEPSRILEVIARQLEKPQLERDIKKISVNAIGNLQDIRGIPLLTQLTKDSIPDVRFNAALALAYLGSADGQDVLWKMLDQNALKTIEGITPEQATKITIEALKALFRLKLLTKEKLTELNQKETNLEVKNVLLKYLQEIK